VVGDLIYRLQRAGHEAWIIGASTNSKQIQEINKLDCDCGLELHFNSFVSKDMFGTEVLHADSKNGRKLAQCIQSKLVDKLKTKDRGVKLGHYQQNVRKPIISMLTDTNCPFVIPEPLFLSNDEDLLKIDIKLISIAIFEGLESYQNLI
jgi:N-acetylmuramoyl-L-alanine amidase